MVCTVSHADDPIFDRLSYVPLETIWVDFVLKNPLQVEVELTDLTAVVKEAGKTKTDQPQEGLVEVEEIDKICLAPGEQRTVSMLLRFPSLTLTSRCALNARSQSPSNVFDRRSWCSQNSPTNSSPRSLVRNHLVLVGDDSMILLSRDKTKPTLRMCSSK